MISSEQADGARRAYGTLTDPLEIDTTTVLPAEVVDRIMDHSSLTDVTGH
jgi:hypothetical protein